MGFNIEYITNYVLGYDTGMPDILWDVLALVSCGLIFGLYFVKPMSYVRSAFKCLLLEYVLLMVCITVFFRDSYDNVHYYLRPLWSYHVLYERLIAEIIMNVLLFIPFGFFVGASMRCPSFFKTIGSGLALSVTIELVQLVTRRGVCNIDDVIHNALGCAIGYVLIKFCDKNVRLLRWCIRKKVSSLDSV